MTHDPSKPRGMEGISMSHFGPGQPQRGPTGPTGPQGAQGTHWDRYPDVHKYGIQRDALGEPVPAVPADRSHPAHPDNILGPQEAERRIKDFFRSSGQLRRGLNLECPFCKAAVVVQERGRDGRMFFGCTRYPSCSGTWDIPSESQEEAKNWHRRLSTPDHTRAMLPSKSVDKDIEESLKSVLSVHPAPGRFHQYVACRTIGMWAMTEEVVPRKVHISIEDGTYFQFDGSTLIVGTTDYNVPSLKGAILHDWAVPDEPTSIEEVAAYKARKAKREEKAKMNEAKEKADVEVPSNSIKARLARSAKRAPYRVARMRALSEGRKAILAALRPRVQPATFDLVEAFLDTDAGQGAIIGLIGLAGPYTPKLGQNKHVQAVCEEFLDEGVAKGANEVFGLLGMILEPVLKSVMSSLPEVEEVANKVVPKRRKKRVATSDVRVKASEEAEEEDEAPEPRRKNALRAIG